MNKERLIETINLCIEEIKGEKIEELTGKSFVDDLDFDSVEMVELIVALEEHLGMDLAEDIMLENFDTYENFVEGIWEVINNAR